MRFVVDLINDPETGLAGRVEVADRPPVDFSGWLALLRLLEDCVHEAGTSSTTSPDGAETQEIR